jgi:hypothetical protein
MADRGNFRIEAARVSIAQYAVGDGDAGAGPASDGSTGPEIDIIRVGNDHQRPLNLCVSKNHDHSRQLAS